MDRTSEEGRSLFKEEMVEYFPLLFFGPFARTGRLFASGYLVLAKYLGIYGLSGSC